MPTYAITVTVTELEGGQLALLCSGAEKAGAGTPSFKSRSLSIPHRCRSSAFRQTLVLCLLIHFCNDDFGGLFFRIPRRHHLDGLLLVGRCVRP